MTPTSPYAEWLAVAKFSYMLYFYSVLSTDQYVTAYMYDPRQNPIPQKKSLQIQRFLKCNCSLSEHANAKHGSAQNNVSSDTMVLEIIPYFFKYICQW